MKRLIISLACAATFIAGGYSFYYYNIRDASFEETYSFWVAIGIPIGLLIVSVGLLVWACSDNIYGIKRGKVIEHSYSPAHRTAPTITSVNGMTLVSPGQMIPAQWSICLRDERGRTGWLNFTGSSIHQAYPVGSNYPG